MAVMLVSIPEYAAMVDQTYPASSPVKLLVEIDNIERIKKSE